MSVHGIATVGNAHLLPLCFVFAEIPLLQFGLLPGSALTTYALRCQHKCGKTKGLEY